MSTRNLDALFSPRSVAVIGATPREGALGRIVFEQLLAGGFEGPVHAVNPKHSQLLDHPVHASPAALPEPPDLAVVTTPARTVPGVLHALGEAGCRAAAVLSAGVDRASGLRGASIEAARRHGLRLLGPNSLGLMRPNRMLNASYAHRMPVGGRLAFLSQSGAIISGVIDWAAARGIGFSHVVSLGEEADVTVADILDHLATEAESRAILLYLEGIDDAAAFLSAARAAARVKPLIVLKAGRHRAARRAASSHSGAVAGTEAVFDAAFARAGALRITTPEELFDAAEILDHTRTPRSDRLAVIGNSGGAGVLAADAIGDVGGRVATLSAATRSALAADLPAHASTQNPVDLAGDADGARYAAAADAVLADPEVDALLAINGPTALSDPLDAAEAVIAAAQRHRKASHRPKPVITAWLGEGAAAPARAALERAHIATFRTPTDAVRGWGYLIRRAALLERISRVPPSLPEGMAPDWAAARAAIEAAAARGARRLNEAEAKAVISAAGIPTVRTLVAATPAEARAAAETLAGDGAPRFALKALSDDFVHKSDVGGVILDLADPAAVEAAAERMLAQIAERAPAARISGLSVQEMLRRPTAHELLCGISEDPVFGPTIVFGAGGLAVEVVNDIALGLPPLDLALARDLIAQTRVSRLLAGYRTRPAADLDAIAAVLLRLAEIARALPMIRELDINPLLADDRGAIALDARVVISPSRMDETAPNHRLAIRPYPVELEGSLTLRDGSRVFCRPIRPEDAPIYRDFFARIDTEDMRLRFFTPMRQVPERLIATLTQIDYARAMAFLAFDPEDDALMGVARLAADADGETAEYGILVRSDLKGRGVGRALMNRLIAHGRAVGLREIWGEVLAENTGMLHMAEGLGFRSAPNFEEGLVHVTLDLTHEKLAD
ncbi:MAG: bifunctional acetate--CoA ligase family protein/GNAT family N-acetyltransferase [Pseudomonadota bacterium]